jgi:hypothetical protein
MNRLRTPDAGGMVVSSDGDGETVWFADGATPMRPSDDRERLKPGAADSKERRSEPRNPANRLATVKVLNPQTSDRISARLVEISKGGLKLRLSEPLMPGTLVQIRFSGKLVLAEVRYCNVADAEFHVGVRLQDIFQTTPDDE